jgi:hypothetical protein
MQRTSQLHIRLQSDERVSERTSTARDLDSEHALHACTLRVVRTLAAHAASVCEVVVAGGGSGANFELKSVDDDGEDMRNDEARRGPAATRASSGRVDRAADVRARDRRERE